MILVGKSKFSNNNRISLIKDIPDLLNLQQGDNIEFHIEDSINQSSKNKQKHTTDSIRNPRIYSNN